MSRGFSFSKAVDALEGIACLVPLVCRFPPGLTGRGAGVERSSSVALSLDEQQAKKAKNVDGALAGFSGTDVAVLPALLLAIERFAVAEADPLLAAVVLLFLLFAVVVAVAEFVALVAAADEFFPLAAVVQVAGSFTEDFPAAP